MLHNRLLSAQRLAASSQLRLNLVSVMTPQISLNLSFIELDEDLSSVCLSTLQTLNTVPYIQLARTLILKPKACLLSNLYIFPSFPSVCTPPSKEINLCLDSRCYCVDVIAHILRMNQPSNLAILNKMDARWEVCVSMYITYISVSTSTHGQCPAPMGSWRVND